ncbi:response regulator [Candidatus Soleaferrea massiliensis]|uniref:response regulator n=1 Tax=Candidatus Soleaferrea massiliensis TaxID=1470354 RepID=UPI000591744E|nr:response regulator [Candidatus Soleaferrea massiliensis]
MYSVVLVDDQEEVRERIKKTVNWEEVQFQVTGEAANGLDALEVIEKTDPDAVIMDISMPFMNGLELAKLVGEKFPTTKSVILTGFDEFEFAQKAIRYGVADYLLKPLSAEDITALFEKLKGMLDQERARMEDIESLEKYYKESFPVLKAQFLSSVISSAMDRETIEHQAQVYGIRLAGDYTLVSVIKIDYLSCDEHSPFNHRNDFDKNLMRFAVMNIVQEIVEKHKLGLSFLHNEYIVTICMPQAQSSQQAFEMVSNAFSEVSRNIEKYLMFSITVGVGNLCEDCSQLKNSYEYALKALDYRAVMNDNKVILIDDVEPKHPRKVSVEPEFEKKLISCIKFGSVQEIDELLDAMFRNVVIASYKEYQIYLLEMLTCILRISKDVGIETMDLLSGDFNAFQEILTLNNLDRVKRWFHDVCVSIIQEISTERENNNNNIIYSAIEYIEKNYGDNTLSVNKICEILHVSPNYFSTLFKKKMGVSFSNYLSSKRLEIAKELLRTTNLKAFQISDAIGYSESNYFSHSFKKTFGVSPTEYRSSFSKA